MKKILFLLLLMAQSSLIAQLYVDNYKKQYMAFVYEVVSGDTILRDSINSVLSSMFTGKTLYAVEGRLIYYAYLVRGTTTDWIAINTLLFPETGTFVPLGQKEITKTDFPLLFKHDIRIIATPDGFQLTLKDSRISSVIYSYKDFKFDNFLKFLRCLEVENNFW